MKLHCLHRMIGHPYRNRITRETRGYGSGYRLASSSVLAQLTLTEENGLNTESVTQW